MFWRTLYRLSSRKLILHDSRELKRIHDRAKPKDRDTDKQIKKIFTVSLVGLPNCGKSTLFNVISGQRLAITDSIPGMTRDRKEITLWDGLLRLIDTAGVELNNKSAKQHGENMKEDMFKQTMSAHNQADVTLFVIDAKKGITDEEKSFVNYLRKYTKISKVMLVVNKCQGVAEDQVIDDVSKLGFEKVFYVSAQFGDGVLQLMQSIDKMIPARIREEVQDRRQLRRKRFEQLTKRMLKQLSEQASGNIDLTAWERDFRKLNGNPEENSELDQELTDGSRFTRPEELELAGRGVFTQNMNFKKTIEVCVIGRPNVGKSSLINHLIGEQKMLVNSEPHTTRQPIISQWTYKDRKMRLIDTAGLNSTNFDENPQHLKKVQVATMNHVKFSHVVIYLIDALSAMKLEDFTFIRRIMQEGRAVVLAVNKWEAIKSEFKKKAARYLNHQIETHLGDLNKPSIVYLSVKTSQGIEQLMQSILKSYERWNMRISTGMLNDWLRKFKKLDNLPRDGDSEFKIRYIVQAKTRPPTFIVFTNNKQLVKENYIRFMRSNLVEQFGLQGSAVRIVLKNVRSAKKETTKKSKLAKKRKEDIKTMKRKDKLLQLKLKYGNFGVKK